MKDINMIYTDLIHQKREAEARLTEYQKKTRAAAREEK